jgi:hypothetical protein
VPDYRVELESERGVEALGGHEAMQARARPDYSHPIVASSGFEAAAGAASVFEYFAKRLSLFFSDPFIISRLCGYGLELVV